MGGSDSKEKEAPKKEEIKQPALKEDIKKVEKEFAAKEAAAAKERNELMGGGTKDLRSNGGGDGGLQHKEKSDIEIETEKLRAKARKDMHSAVDNSIETLAMTHDQIQQSKDDTKRLHRINEKLTEAEASLKELERGFFNISSSGKAVALPPRGELDDELPIQMYKNWMTRYHPYTLRFTGACVMRINGKQELKDTCTYNQIEFCKVLKKGDATDQYIQFHFDPKLGVPDNMWEIVSTDRAALVTVLAQRTYDATEKELTVDWEAGVSRFDITVTKRAQALRDKFTHGHSGGSQSGGAKKKDDPWGIQNEAHDAFLDDILADANTMMDISKAQSEAFKEHMGVLEDQQEIMQGTKGRLNAVNKRTHEVEKNI